MLFVRIRILPIIQINQLDTDGVIVAGVAPFPGAAAGMPGSVHILDVLNDLPIFTNRVVGTDLGVGIVEPLNHTL